MSTATNPASSKSSKPITLFFRIGTTMIVVTDVSGDLIAISTERAAVAKTKNGLAVNGAKTIQPNFDLIVRIVEDYRCSQAIQVESDRLCKRFHQALHNQEK